jgi:hypothetical protein
MAKSLDRETLARVAPKLAELSQDVLFNDIWQRRRFPRASAAWSRWVR